MSASPSHPVAVPVDLQAGAVPKVLNLAEAAAFVRCSRAHLSTSSITRFPVSHTSRVSASVGVFSSGANRLSSGLKRSKQACRRELPVRRFGHRWC